MPWNTTLNGVRFVDELGDSVQQVPESCIESAEQIVQSFALGYLLPPAREGRVRDPMVVAKFGDLLVNISAADIFGGRLPVRDYNFRGQLPGLGQGLMLLLKDDVRHLGYSYHMHVGAIVGEARGRRLISDLSRGDQARNPPLVDVRTMEIQNPDAFRGEDYPSEAFALGLVRVVATKQEARDLR